MSILEKLTQQRPTDPLVDLARVCEHASVCIYEMVYIAGLPPSPSSTEMNTEVFVLRRFRVETGEGADVKPRRFERVRGAFTAALCMRVNTFWLLVRLALL